MNNNPNSSRRTSSSAPKQSFPRQRPSVPQGKAQRNGAQNQRPSGYRRAPEEPIRNNNRPNTSSGKQPVVSGYRYGRSKSFEDYLVWFLVAAVALLLTLVIIFIAVRGADRRGEGPHGSGPDIPAGPASPSESQPNNPDNNPELPTWNAKPSNPKGFVPKTTQNTEVASGLNSEYAILVSLSDNSVIASKSADQRMYPASMTKIMTVIVACESIADMWDTFTITTDIRWPLDNTGASMAWFKINRPIYLIDLIYGAWLPSGADATTALAVKLAGSEEAFVKKMNEKAAEIGCTGTHFVNTTGLHHDDHYSTVRDIATIMAYAVNNPFIKQVMCSKSYNTYAELEKSENKLYATWYNTLVNMSGDYSFLKGAKTGYETTAGSCMASLITGDDGKEYVVVTGKATYTDQYSGSENRFIDLKKLYNDYVK